MESLPILGVGTWHCLRKRRADGHAGDAEWKVIEAFEIKIKPSAIGLQVCVHFAVLSVLAHHACMLRCLHVSATHQQSDVPVPTVRSIAHLNRSLLKLHGQCNGDRHSAWGLIAHDGVHSRIALHGPRPSHRTTGKDPSADTLEQRTRRGADNLESTLFESAGSAPVAVAMVAALRQPSVSFDFTSAGTIPSLIWILYCLFSRVTGVQLTNVCCEAEDGKGAGCRWTVVCRVARCERSLWKASTLEAVCVASSSCWLPTDPDLRSHTCTRLG
jgi:hypothetical protein